ncbi:MAG: hypothetical protein PQJ46_03780 [Spirochaetales bacterium]|nr:hypothetical protein [Spirochaetales bacterium]
MQQKITYQAGVSQAWIINDEKYLEYDCGTMQNGKINKSDILAIGLQPPNNVVVTDASQIIHRSLGSKGGLGGILISYKTNNSKKIKNATITFDFGDEGCINFINDLLSESGNLYIGSGTRNELMKKMGISRTKENIIILLVILGVVAFATIMVSL